MSKVNCRRGRSSRAPRQVKRACRYSTRYSIVNMEKEAWPEKKDFRQDGDDDPHRTEHGVVYSLADFQGVLDALVVAVKPATIRLNGACLDDEEGQSRHEEAEEVEADEQHPLAAAFPRVVVERRAAAVLTLRDDRLVVLVALHGAGCGEPPWALRAAAAQERVCGLGTRRRVCSPAE